MAGLPEDMQFVSVILFKRDVKRLDTLVQTRRWRSRSILMRELIEKSLDAFSLTDCSVNRADVSDKEQPADLIAA